MLTNDFTQEMGALVRSLEQRVRVNPILQREDEQDAIDHIEEAIIVLIALRLRLTTKGER